MAERDPSNPGERTDGTLLGVPAPRVDASPESALRKPVFVRAGTSTVDGEGEPPPLPRMALPSRPLLPLQPGASEAPPTVTNAAASEEQTRGLTPRVAAALRRSPALWMVGAPVAASVLVVLALVTASPAPAPSAQLAPSASGAVALAAAASPAEPPPALRELESKPEGSLSTSELVALWAARSQRKVAQAHSLRLDVERTPSRAADKATQSELFRYAADAETAREALAAMAKAPGPLAADLLYEVWTGTAERSPTTELARAMVHSTDLRPSASPALSVALTLRAAEACEQARDALPAALKDGDRRSLHLLTKLTNKRGCGPKKTEDCYACLREQQQELLATINAVKVRRPPALGARGAHK